MLRSLVFSVILAAAQPCASEAAQERIEIRMDPRFELMSAVMLLARADERFQGFFVYDVPYAAKMKKHFGRHAGHPAVARYVELAFQSLQTDDALALMHRVSPPPELELVDELYPNMISGFGGAKEVESFLGLLRDFSSQSDFPKFYRRTESLRAAMIEEVRRQVKTHDPAGPFLRYSGIPLALRYSFVLSPFTKGVGTAADRRVGPDGNLTVVSVLGPTRVQAARLEYHFDWRVGDIWEEAAYHQFLPVGERHRLRIAAAEELFEPIRNSCHDSWHQCAQRQIATAVKGRMFYQAGDAASAAELPTKYARFGNPHVGALMERLEEYERERQRYATLADFYPRLLDVYDELLAKGREPAQFTGGLSAVLEREQELTVVLPRGSPGAVKRAARARWPRAGLLTEDGALKADLSGRSVVVLGLPEDNLWLSRRLVELHLPIRPAADRIVISRELQQTQFTFTGKLRFASIARNPDNPAKAVLLYCAPSAEDLVWLIGQDFGPWDFILYDGERSLKAGTYEKSRLPWRVQ